MSTEETVQAPNFKIWIAKANPVPTTTKTKDGIEVKFISRTKLDPPHLTNDQLNIFNEELNAHTTELIIHETMQAADSFTIKMIDPDMSFMFGENLFIGRYIFISIGLGQEVVHKVDGFINSMQYEFPSNGLPVLVIEGYGTVWDLMSKDVHMWRIRIADKPEEMGPTVYFNKTYTSLKEFFDTIQAQFGLEPIDWGRTIPKDLEQRIQLEGKSREFKGMPSGRMSAWEYLGQLADRMGCIFFLKGREMHFYPAAWIDAPVDFDKRAAEKKSAIVSQISKTNNPIQKASLLKKLGSLNQSIKEVISKTTIFSKFGKFTTDKEAKTGKTFWYKMDNPLRYGTGYNLLSFKPELQNLQVGGYFGMAMDPKSGRITFGKATENDNLGSIQTATPTQGTSGYNPKTGQFISEKPPAGQVTLSTTKKAPPATVKTPTPPGTSAAPKPKPSLLDKVKSAAKNKLKEYVQKLVPSGLLGGAATSSVESALTPGKQGVRVMQPEAGKSDEEMGGLSAASYRKWMWFATAQAEVIGDPHLTVAMPVWIYGFGSPQQLKEGVHNEKICGKWYVFGVTHRITTGKAYLCELELKRFWQWAQPTHPSDEDHTNTKKVDDVKLVLDTAFGKKVTVVNPLDGTAK
jgi:hypothetical protein